MARQVKGNRIFAVAFHFNILLWGSNLCASTASAKSYILTFGIAVGNFYAERIAEMSIEPPMARQIVRFFLTILIFMFILHILSC